MPNHCSLLLASIAAIVPLCAHAQTIYLNETFDTDTLGAAPDDAALRRTGLVTVAAGSGLIGNDNVAHFSDAVTNAGGILEYNVGTEALSSLYVSFDIFNNAANNTGSAANPIIFSVGNWSNTTGVALNSTANRSFGLELSQTGSSSTLKVRIGGTNIVQTTYDMAAVNTFKIFINDHSTNTVDYLVPGTSTTATLSANSAAFYINNTLVGSSLASGIGLNTTASGGYLLGDTTLGRIGFNTGSTGLADFLIDNVYASAIPSTIPEPSTAAALAGAGILGVALVRRRRR